MFQSLPVLVALEFLICIFKTKLFQHSWTFGSILVAKRCCSFWPVSVSYFCCFGRFAPELFRQEMLLFVVGCLLPTCIILPALIVNPADVSQQNHRTLRLHLLETWRNWSKRAKQKGQKIKNYKQFMIILYCEKKWAKAELQHLKFEAVASHFIVLSLEAVSMFSLWTQFTTFH